VPGARWLRAWWALALLFLGCSSDSAPGPAGPGGLVVDAQEPASAAEADASAPGPVAMRRLTRDQYVRSVHDVLGQDLVVPSRLEPDLRRGGLLSVGASQVSVTPTGMERYEAAARAIAAQALAPEYRASVLACVPASPDAADADCAGSFLAATGRALLRRPLEEDELQGHVALAGAASAALADFHGGLEVALSALLISPDFLFRPEQVDMEAATDDSGARPLTSLSLASRLSYLLWNTTPDAALLDAGVADVLQDGEALAAQVDRLLASDRLKVGVRAFFEDLYALADVEQSVRKDATLFPLYNPQLMEAAREQTLRTLEAHLVDGSGDYRALFTTRETQLTRALGVIYQVPVRAAEGWEAHTFAASVPRAGLLTHLSLLALHAHSGRSSATLRGRFVREVLLCQAIPEPPADVDFSIVEDVDGPLATARDRLQVHAVNPGCAACHAKMDPIGLGLEQFDALGVFRETENGATIDPASALDGMAFADPAELGEVLAGHPELGPCLVSRLYSHALGRELEAGDNSRLALLQEAFSDGGYQLSPLLRALALSEGFRRGAGPRALVSGSAAQEAP